MKIRIDKRDKKFSELIRLRDRWTCQRCGRFYPKGHGLQCAHVFSRRHQSTRYEPDNAVSLCFTDHQYFGENPVIFTAWIKKYLGDVRYEALQLRHMLTVKRTKAELEELYQHLKDEFAALLADPNHAVVGFD